MAFFKDMLSDRESLFVNETALDIDYVPPIIKYRENQQAYMADSIKPLLGKRNGKNLFITGQPGIGKTVAVRHVFSELSKETDDVIPIYINCWKKDTFYKVVLEICEQLGYRFVMNKKADELFREVAKMLNKKTAVFCLDEIDKLDDHQILYSIVEDIYKKSIFLITNDRGWFSTMDPRLRSRLVIEDMEFKPYNFDETRGILEQRREFAFVEGVWDDDAFEAVVEKTAELGDIRTGLFLLREAGCVAEHRSSKRITLSDAEQAISRLASFKPRKSDEMDANEKSIAKLVLDNPDKTTKELYGVYSKDKGISYRTFQKKVKGLANANLISITKTKTGSYRLNHGRTKNLGRYSS